LKAAANQQFDEYVGKIAVAKSQPTAWFPARSNTPVSQALSP
jgi:hypothetical protein